MTLINKQTQDAAWGEFADGFVTHPCYLVISFSDLISLHSLRNGGFNAPRRGKHDDHAHPPIHPTAWAGNLVGDEKRVYEYITRRFLACCSKDALGWQTTVEVKYGEEEFSTTGKTPSMLIGDVPDHVHRLDRQGTQLSRGIPL